MTKVKGLSGTASTNGLIQASSGISWDYRGFSAIPTRHCMRRVLRSPLENLGDVKLMRERLPLFGDEPEDQL